MVRSTYIDYLNCFVAIIVPSDHTIHSALRAVSHDNTIAADVHSSEQPCIALQLLYSSSL